ncbi:unnamed protein product [Danaus chrysippus]|uniref:(African queen) hypothetical protein n=2 Tax=Danaus chrysippus TaxID=151541 RepID=A0A8J2VS16_9NEOP|nr:unnamed protein product [Danaus chrysippus]
MRKFAATKPHAGRLGTTSKEISIIKMAWGYWSASSVMPDRGRSPRRAGTSVVHAHPNPPTAREVMETHDESIIHTASTSRDSRDHSASPHSSSNGGHSHHHEVRHAVPASALFGESYGELSRRPSLDLGSVRSALASCSGGGTLSAGSTLTRGGTLADYLPPTPCPHHHRVYVDHHKHYEQPIQPVHVGVPHHSHSHASSRHHTDDEDDLEPAYATGMSINLYLCETSTYSRFVPKVGACGM